MYVCVAIRLVCPCPAAGGSSLSVSLLSCYHLSNSWFPTLVSLPIVSDKDCGVRGAVRAVGGCAGAAAATQPPGGVQNPPDRAQDLPEAHRVPQEGQGGLQEVRVRATQAGRQIVIVLRGVEVVCVRVWGKVLWLRIAVILPFGFYLLFSHFLIELSFSVKQARPN